MPFSQGEIDGSREVFVDDVFDRELSRTKLAAETRD